MATLQDNIRQPPLRASYGIRVGVTFPEVNVSAEIRRAPDLAGAPNVASAATIGFATPESSVFTDVLPNDGAQRWYSARCIDDIRQPSDWTAWAPERPYHLGRGSTGGAQVAPMVQAVPSGATLSGVPAEDVARRGHGIFFEPFETADSIALFDCLTQQPALSIVSGVGQAGGKVLQIAGADGWLVYRNNVPFDPSKLYRMRARIRMTVAPTNPAQDNVYVGVEGIAADGSTYVNSTGANSFSNQHYICASGVDFGALTLNTWYEFTGFFKGTNNPGDSTPSTDASAPKKLHTNVRYFRPLVGVNNSGGNGTFQVDEIAIDVLDEEGAKRTWAGFDTNSEVQKDLPEPRKVKGGTKQLWRAHTHLIPNGEFEFWEPVNLNLYGWAPNQVLPGTYVVAQDATNVFSGDYSLGVSRIGGAASPTYANVGYTSNNAGSDVRTTPMRRGRRYRLVIAAMAPTTVAGRKYRVRLQYNSLLDNVYIEKEFDFLQSGGWQVDDWTFTVDTLLGSKNCGFSIDAKLQNGDYAAFDSIRLIEDPDDYKSLTGQLGDAGYNLAVNGSFEEGLSFWGWSTYDTPSNTVTADNAAPYSGAYNLKVTRPLFGGATQTIIRQLDRSGNDVYVPGKDLRVRVLPGEELVIRAVLKVSAGTVSVGAGVSEYADPTTTSVLNNTTPVASSSTSWVVIESSMKVSASTFYVTPLVYITGLNSSGDWAMVDEIRIFRKAGIWKALAYRSSSAQSIATATYTAVQFNNEQYDNFGSHDNTTNPERLSIPVHGSAMPKAGLFQLNANVQFASSAGGVERRLRIRQWHDGTGLFETLAECIYPESSGTAIAATLPITAYSDDVRTLDYFICEAYQDTGANLNINAGRSITWFSLTQLM